MLGNFSSVKTVAGPFGRRIRSSHHSGVIGLAARQGQARIDGPRLGNRRLGYLGTSKNLWQNTV
jgi:hypothetical protein